MIDVFWYYISTLAFVSAIGSLFCVYRYFLGNKLTAQANKLKSQIANIKQTFPEFEEKRSQMVASGINDLGIDGLLDELGIPGAFKPLAKGFIDRIAQNPEMIKGIAEKFGVKLPDETNKATSEYL